MTLGERARYLNVHKVKVYSILLQEIDFTMISPLDEAKLFYSSHQEQFLAHYFSFLRFQSISGNAKYKDQVMACAHWLSEQIRSIGLEVEIWGDQETPIIIASSPGYNPDYPTLLLYNHYDVQSAEPLSEWKSNPFDPILDEGEVYARGAQDNKGQCFYTFLAIQAILQKHPAIPINIKWCIEGEEECGSITLKKMLQDPNKRKQLQADYIAIVDMYMQKPSIPAITYGIRGIVRTNIEVTGANTELHSGSHGGIIYNPNQALVEILAKLHDDNGKILVPGFYDDVQELDKEVKARIAWTFDSIDYKNRFHVEPVGGEQDYSPLERAWIRPTLEINGIFGGIAESGFKASIPMKSIAKISCRLVPNQDPCKISKLLADYIQKITPKGIVVTVQSSSGSRALQGKLDSALAKAFTQSFEEVFQNPCEMIFDGGSIPVLSELSNGNGDFILVGLGLPTDQIHAANEHFGLDRLEKGFCVIYRAIQLLSNSPRPVHADLS